MTVWQYCTRIVKVWHCSRWLLIYLSYGCVLFAALFYCAFVFFSLLPYIWWIKINVTWRTARQTPTDGSRDCNETCRMLVPIVQVRTIPASVDVDWQLDVAPHRLLEHRAVCVVVALGVQRQLALVGTNGHLATQHHSVTPPHECAVKSLKTGLLWLSSSSGGAVVQRVRHLGLRSVGRGFKSCSRQRCVTTLGKLFTPMSLCHQAV